MQRYTGTVYCGVKRVKPEDELKHWKYIKKERVNGKWRYYYDDELANKYADGVVEQNANETVAYNKDGKLDLKSKYNKVSTNTTRYTDSKRLFSRTTTDKIVEKGKGLLSNTESTKTVVTKERGLLERAAAKGEKWIYNTFLKKKNK